jgi:hypothetical protein
MRTLTYITPLLLLVGAFAACSDDGGRGGARGGSGADGSGAGNGSGGLPIDPGTEPPDPTGVILVPECESECLDFPAEPIVEGVTDAQRAALDQPASGAGPCVTEPADGTIFPARWTRPRFNFQGGAVHKITLSAERQKHDLVVYTNQSPWYLPAEIWAGLSKNVFNEDITYSIKTGSGTGAPTETTGKFRIVPVAAGGSMVFWGSTGTTPGAYSNALYGFSVGDEAVIHTLAPGDIDGVAIADNANPRNDGQSLCVGCHSSTPGGKAVATVDHWPWNVRIASIEEGIAGSAPDFLTPAGAAMASMTWLGATTFSEADWATGARRMVVTWSERNLSGSDAWKTHDGSVLSNLPTQLVWMDLGSSAEMPTNLLTSTSATYTNQNQALQNAVAALRGTGWDVIQRTGDPGSPVLPNWSHDGTNIIYTSTDVPQDGRIGEASVVDIYRVPYGAGAGGEATPVPGASSPAFYEYYPDYSPDDALIAFNRVDQFTTSGGREDSFNHVYYRPDSDIYVLPSTGGDPVRLVSNDPACSSEGTAGDLYNSWAKWAPTSASDGERTYYFLIFSTSRNSPFEISRGSGRFSPASQLYMTTIIKHANGTIESSPAIYLWNQRVLVDAEGNPSDLGTNNVTPAWDAFKIPPVPPVVVR